MGGGVTTHPSSAPPPPPRQTSLPSPNPHLLHSASGAIILGFASLNGQSIVPKSAKAWAWIAAFSLVDATMFQGFLAEGLRRTSAGLGSVIIDSQPLTVALLASVFFGEQLGAQGVVGLLLGLVGIGLVEVCRGYRCWQRARPTLHATARPRLHVARQHSLPHALHYITLHDAALHYTALH